MIDRFLLANAEKCIYTRVYDTIESKEKNIMKTKILVCLLSLTVTMASLTGCGSSSDVVESTEVTADATTSEDNAVETEPPHEHTYTETITTPATCEADGVKTFTCECGDTYTEPIATQGHVFENYTSNNDATYTADGTETAKCNNCDVTDTRTAEGSMLTYTYTDMDATMYAQKTVNVRSLPNTDGEKLGSLSTNDEVKVTGQCAETSWYRIEYSGGAAYVSNSYLGNDKVVIEQPKTEQTAQSTSSECPYPLYTVIDDGGTNVYFYHTENSLPYSEAFWNCFNSCYDSYIIPRVGNVYKGSTFENTPYTSNGVAVKKAVLGAVPIG